uniref:Uncharacterized protein n=1 Tax=viral metagenome TaxID=1070528 RepID=A0A6C0J656_9ZZZZ
MNIEKNTLIFDKLHLQSIKKCTYDSFSGAIVDSDSYTQLLDLVDMYYGLGMKTNICPYPLQEYTYMLISKDNRYFHKLLGKQVKLRISHLYYNSYYGVLAAKVILKNNFTSNKTPHIVIAKKTELNNSVIKQIIDGELDYKYPCIKKKLHAEYTLHGKIGVLCNSDLENDIVVEEIHEEKNNTVHYSGKKVYKPELTVAVECFPPPIKDKKYLSIHDLKNNKITPFVMSETESNESNESVSDDDNIITTSADIFQGCQIEQGPRGGKYIMKDGRKKYIKDGDLSVSKTSSTYSSNRPVYSLNLLN